MSVCSSLCPHFDSRLRYLTAVCTVTDGSQKIQANDLVDPLALPLAPPTGSLFFVSVKYPTSIGWIALTFGTDINVAPKINPTTLLIP